jgi:hypothetical protein
VDLSIARYDDEADAERAAPAKGPLVAELL